MRHDTDPQCKTISRLFTAPDAFRPLTIKRDQLGLGRAPRLDRSTELLSGVGVAAPERAERVLSRPPEKKSEDPCPAIEAQI